MITKSFARIHEANLINAGILPFTFANEADYDRHRARIDELRTGGGMRALLTEGNAPVVLEERDEERECYPLDA